MRLSALRIYVAPVVNLHLVIPLLRCHLSTGALRREEIAAKGTDITTLKYHRDKTRTIKQDMMQQLITDRARLVECSYREAAQEV